MYRSEAYYMSEKYIAYVGSYTHESSKGIHLYDMDVEDVANGHTDKRHFCDELQ